MLKISFQEYRKVKNRLLDEIKIKCGIPNDALAGTKNVLLYKDGESEKVGAYINFDDNQFFLPACKEWKNNIKGVFDFRVCVIENEHFTPVRQESFMEEKDFSDYYVLISREEGNECFIELYHKNEIVFSVKTADVWFKCGIDLKIIYRTENNGIYTHWIYKNGETNALLDSSDMWFSKSEYRNNNMNFPNVIFDDFVVLFFHYVNCKSFYISEYFARTTGDCFVLLPKQFEDDDTCNYMVKFKRDRYDDIALMNYFIQPEIAGYAVYGLPIQEIKNGCIRKKSEESLYIELELIWESIEYELQCREILKHIYELLNIDEDLYCVPKIQYYDRTSAQSTSVAMYIQENRDKNNVISSSYYKEKYNSIYDKLIKDGVVFPKWKSEYELYQMVKRKYPDAIYQYRAKWLGIQSLDIYIPSLKIGIEYQGEQHYKPIILFGGEKEFEHRKILDETKKLLCKENEVRLIEWKYDEIINVVSLGKKINDVTKKTIIKSY